MADTIGTWAILVNGTCVATAIADVAYGTAQGWTEIDALTPEPGVGWTLSGSVWSPPVPTTTQTNRTTTQTNILTRQAAIQAWIAANPSGAVLTAGQTLTVAEMLNGLCNLLLGNFGSTTGT